MHSTTILAELWHNNKVHLVHSLSQLAYRQSFPFYPMALLFSYSTQLQPCGPLTKRPESNLRLSRHPVSTSTSQWQLRIYEWFSGSYLLALARSLEYHLAEDNLVSGLSTATAPYLHKSITSVTYTLDSQTSHINDAFIHTNWSPEYAPDPLILTNAFYRLL